MDPAAKETIEREQFQPLPKNEAEEIWINKCLVDIKRLGLEDNLKTYEDVIQDGENGPAYRPGANVQLHLAEYASLINPVNHKVGFPKLTQGVTEVYDQCIVRYKNAKLQNDLQAKYNDDQTTYQQQQASI